MGLQAIHFVSQLNNFGSLVWERKSGTCTYWGPAWLWGEGYTCGPLPGLPLPFVELGQEYKWTPQSWSSALLFPPWLCSELRGLKHLCEHPGLNASAPCTFSRNSQLLAAL